MFFQESEVIFPSFRIKQGQWWHVFKKDWVGVGEIFDVLFSQYWTLPWFSRLDPDPILSLINKSPECAYSSLPVCLGRFNTMVLQMFSYFSFMSSQSTPPQHTFFCFENSCCFHSQACSNHHLCKMTTCLRWPMLSPPKQIPIWLLLFNMITCLTQPAATFFVCHL